MATEVLASVTGHRVLKFTGVYSGESWERDYAYMVLLCDVRSDAGHRLKQVWVRTQYQFKQAGAKRGERYTFEASWYKYRRGDLHSRWGLSLECLPKKLEA